MNLKTYRIDTLALDLYKARGRVFPCFVLAIGAEAYAFTADLASVDFFCALFATLGFFWLGMRAAVRARDLLEVAGIVQRAPREDIATIWPFITLMHAEPRGFGDRVFNWLFRCPVSEMFRRPMAAAL